jgi:hypothetical protein
MAPTKYLFVYVYQRVQLVFIYMHLNNIYCMPGTTLNTSQILS